MNALRLYYFFVFAMYAVVIPHYQVFLRASGYEPLALGIMIGFFEISGVVGPMLLARLADRTGRFREIKAGTTLLAGGVMVFLLMELPFLPAVLISGLTGFLFKVSVPLTDAVAGSVLSDPREQYGKVRVFGSIGFAVAAVLVPAGNLLDQESPESMMIAFLVAMALFAAAVILVRPPASQKSATSAGTDTPGKAKRLEPIFWAVLAAVGLGNIAFGAYNSFFSLYLKEDLGVEAVTVYWAIGAVSEIPIIFYSGKLIRRFGIGKLLTASGIIMTLRLLLYALTPSVILVVFIQLLHALTFGLMLSAGVVFVNQSAPPELRGVAMAAFSAVGIGLAVFIGSIVGGYLVERVGYGAMFAILSISPAVGAAALIYLIRSRGSLIVG